MQKNTRIANSATKSILPNNSKLLLLCTFYSMILYFPKKFPCNFDSDAQQLGGFALSLNDKPDTSDSSLLGIPLHNYYISLNLVIVFVASWHPF